jgi:hypothetical protein
VWIGVAVWLLSVDSGDGTAAVLPDTQAQFSLDLKVIGEVEHDVVYVVEQRARPAYRIFSFDPSTGADETVLTVPTDAIIYGIALSPDRSTLAVAYSADFHIAGSGVSALDVASGKLTEVVPAQPDVYLTELEWSVDGRSVLATHVDRTGTDEQLSVAKISIADKSTEVIVDDAIAPVVDGDGLYYLTVDSEHARRAIGHLDGSGTSTAIAIGDGGFDLDHLIAGGDQTSLHVAVLNTNQGGDLSLGTPADAHGNHKVPSTWWDVAVTPSTATPTALEPIIVYDAASSGSALVYATQEGLAIAVNGTRTDLIASRAIRFVAA